MTHPQDCTLSNAFLEQLCQQGFEGLPELFRLLLNAAMLLERQHHLGAEPYERTPDRQAHANGFKEKTIRARRRKHAPRISGIRKLDPAGCIAGYRALDLLKKGRADRRHRVRIVVREIQNDSSARSPPDWVVAQAWGLGHRSTPRMSRDGIAAQLCGGAAIDKRSVTGLSDSC